MNLTPELEAEIVDEERVGFHFEGQYVEAEHDGKTPLRFFVEDEEIEPSLGLVHAAMRAIRRAE